jgi:aminoglycoside phosphotransferase (APT) family kinase protein
MVHRQDDQEKSAGTAAEMNADDTFSDTTAVRDAHRLDEARLAHWLAQHVPEYAGPLAIEQFRGGQSNPTYKLVTPAKNYVLRRKPPGLLLKGAHAVEREFRVLQALATVGFPVARVYGLCTDDLVIGSWFYVMDCVEGRVIWDATFPNATAEDRPKYFDAMNETIARLHCLDYNAIGLADFGRTGNYFDRQIKRWSKQYQSDVGYAGSDPNMDKLIEWLSARIPKGEDTSIVHGDFRVDNMIFHAVEPIVLAVLDWELSTLGHPLADFAYHLMMYRMPPRIVAGLLGADLAALNIPSESEYIAAYCRRTGRDHIESLDFYVVFNMFRLAAIIHGIKGRLVRGTATSAHAKHYAGGFEWLAELAWSQAQRATM